MANKAPLLLVPPLLAVPYKVSPDNINPAWGLAPSLVVKLCRFVKLVPSVLTANTVPAAKVPPFAAVPYRVLPDNIRFAFGLAPSLFAVLLRRLSCVKIYKLVNLVPSVLIANTVPSLKLPPDDAVPYKVFPDKTKPACGDAPSLPPVKLYKFVKPEPSVLMANTVP